MSKEIINVTNLPEIIQKDSIFCIQQSNPNKYTHGIFKYPCKFIPEIPRWAIQTYKPAKGTVIFDPFSGSGTTLLEANILGYDAEGTEIDDVAKLITLTKTTQFSNNELIEIEALYSRIMTAIINDDAEYRPNINNLEHWFSKDAIKKLANIKCIIDKVEDNSIKSFFKICLASIIKKVSFADDTSPKPYVSNKILKKPDSVEKVFDNTFKRYYEMIKELNTIKDFGKTTIIQGDALNFKIQGKCQLVVTSPPYINAFDYARTMRLENLWLDTETEISLRKRKTQYVGTELVKDNNDISILTKSTLLENYYRQLLLVDHKRALIVKKFFEDMQTNLERVYSQIEKDGRYVIVIGNSNIRNVDIESWKVISELGNKCGFKTENHFSYIIKNPYIRIPRNGKGGHIKYDHIIILKK